jgi:hypothetical protein
MTAGQKSECEGESETKQNESVHSRMVLRSLCEGGLSLSFCFVVHRGIEPHLYAAYYQLFAEVLFQQVSNFTPLCLHLLYKVNYYFDWQ